MIAFRCPVCSSRLGAGADQASATVSCPRCSADLEVPDPTAFAPGELLVADEAAIQFRSGREIVSAEMDMTPMVDVTFLLLIFFMITAAFSLQKSFELPTPNEDQPSTKSRTLLDFESDPEFVVVRIDRFNTYHVTAAHWDEEREAPSEQDLLIDLRDAREGDGQGSIPTRLLVVAHGDARHERVITAMDAGTAVGMEDVKLVTVEEDET